jgi:hypothetical protein
VEHPRFGLKGIESVAVDFGETLIAQQEILGEDIVI